MSKAKWFKGTTRAVCRTAAYVIKFPLREGYEAGLAANLAEIDLWNRWKHAYLCPIFAYDPRGRWLLMRRARLLQRDEYMKRMEETLDALQEFKLATGMSVGDDKRTNMGDLDGRIVIFDYPVVVRLVPGEIGYRPE